MTKETFRENEAIIIVDLATDYQFLIQEEIQSYCWSKEYCQLHPLVVYYLGSDGSLQHDLPVLFLMTTTMIQAFFIKFKQFLMIIVKLKTITHI